MSVPNSFLTCGHDDIISEIKIREIKFRVSRKRQMSGPNSRKVEFKVSFRQESRLFMLKLSFTNHPNSDNEQLILIYYFETSHLRLAICCINVNLKCLFASIDDESPILPLCANIPKVSNRFGTICHKAPFYTTKFSLTCLVCQVFFGRVYSQFLSVNF
jgi:hypothetical protein